MRSMKVFLVSALLTLGCGNAWAQKSQDTLRLALHVPFPGLSRTCATIDEVGNFAEGVYEKLISFEERAQKIVPQLAKSWKHEGNILEFDLRDDILFHNGDKFTADDVVGTIEWMIDPKSKLRFQQRYTWIKTIEKLGPHKVRIVSQAASPVDLQSIAYRFPIQNARLMKSLNDKCDYGRLSPVGTGPYKAVSVDKNVGILVERSESYKGDPKYYRAPIKRVQGVPIPDKQTQIAQLITGGVDLLTNVGPENAKELGNFPQVSVSSLPSGTMLFMQLDAAGRSGSKPMTDPDVRKAIVMAIDRDKIIKAFVPGGDTGVAQKMNGFCFPGYNTACKFSSDYPKYNPEGAKKLLANAGYPNGFEFTFDVYEQFKDIGTAVAGDLLRVGIRANIRPVTFSVFFARSHGGEQNMYMIHLPTSALPDISYILGTFFQGAEDYAHDPLIWSLMKEGYVEFDPVKRSAIYEKALNRITDMNYSVGFSSLPSVYAHSKDVVIKPNPLSAGINYITDYDWK